MIPLSSNHDPQSSQSTQSAGQSGGMLSIDPFRSLNVHFGMLLGVDDFEAVGAYHRGKMWLHNAWLHREGAVWGLGVTHDQSSGELRVGRGLAVDAAGRELHLDVDVCLNLAQWYADRVAENTLPNDPDCQGHIEFDAHVCLQFESCLTRPVPAMADPCAGAGQTTAHSRVLETVAITLVPGEPCSVPLPYHRLRLLFGLDAPKRDSGGNIVQPDSEVLQAIDHIAAKPAAQRLTEMQAAFRRFAALDSIEMAPAGMANGCHGNLFPADDLAPLVLAKVRITMARQCGVLKVHDVVIYTSERATHVATATLQDLLARAAEATVLNQRDAGGPRIDPGCVAFTVQSYDTAAPIQIRLKADRPLHPASVRPGALSLSSFDAAEGWKVIDLCSDDIALEDGNRVIRINARTRTTWELLRVIARGTGTTPLLGANYVPLAGAIADGPGTRHRGNDFIHMINNVI